MKEEMVGFAPPSDFEILRSSISPEVNQTQSQVQEVVFRKKIKDFHKKMKNEDQLKTSKRVDPEYY